MKLLHALNELFRSGPITCHRRPAPATSHLVPAQAVGCLLGWLLALVIDSGWQPESVLFGLFAAIEDSG
ncbi:MAG: hypothetical protein AAFR42_15180 [Cyanobacteria bacterium J06628_6]